MMNLPMQRAPRPKEHYFKVPAIKIDEEDIPETEVNITVFSNRIFIIITQIDKMGTMITGELENPKADEFTEKSYEIKTIFGSSDRQSYEIYCRSILEVLNNKDALSNDSKEARPKGMGSFQSPLMNKMVLLSISLRKFSSEGVEIKVFKYILEAFKANIVHLL